jgi:hypothetical protein
VLGDGGLRRHSRVGLGWAIGWLRWRPARLPGFAPQSRLFIRHGGVDRAAPPRRGSAWGMFYVWTGALSDLNTALYFSAVRRVL